MGSYITLQWDAVSSIGLNGGFIAQNQVYYNVYRAEPVFELGELKEMRLTYLKHVKTYRTDCDVNGLNEGEFENIYFGVCAESELGEGPMTYVEFQKGEKYNPPYMESFTGCETSTYLEVRTDGVSPETGVFLHDGSSDYDGGAAAFETSEENVSVELRTAKIWLSACPNPQLRLSIRNVRGANSLRIAVMNPNNELSTLAVLTPGEEYEHLLFNISEYASDLWLRIFISAEFDPEAVADGGARIDVDDIKAGDAEMIGIKGTECPLPEPADGNIYAPSGLLLRKGTGNTEGLKGIVIIGGRKRLL